MYLDPLDKRQNFELGQIESIPDDKINVDSLMISLSDRAEPHTSVGSVADLRLGGRWFDPHFGQYSFLSHYFPLSRQWLCGKAPSGLERLLCGVLVKRTS